MLGIEAKTKDGAKACWPKHEEVFNGGCVLFTWKLAFFFGKADPLELETIHFQVLWCFQTLKKCTLGPYTPDDTNKKSVHKSINWFVDGWKCFFCLLGLAAYVFRTELLVLGRVPDMSINARKLLQQYKRRLYEMLWPPVYIETPWKMGIEPSRYQLMQNFSDQQWWAYERATYGYVNER